MVNEPLSQLVTRVTSLMKVPGCFSTPTTLADSYSLRLLYRLPSQARIQWRKSTSKLRAGRIAWLKQHLRVNHGFHLKDVAIWIFNEEGFLLENAANKPSIRRIKVIKG